MSDTIVRVGQVFDINGTSYSVVMVSNSSASPFFVAVPTESEGCKLRPWVDTDEPSPRFDSRGSELPPDDAMGTD